MTIDTTTSTETETETRTKRKKKSKAERRRINIKNASMSSGPKTPEGKCQASKNSYKHRLRCSDLILIKDEDREEFRALCNEWNEFYAPKTPGEIALIERAVYSKIQAVRSLHFQ